MEGKETERITPKKAMDLLKDEGIDVDIEQAEMILGFLYEMAEIAVDAYLSRQKNQ